MTTWLAEPIETFFLIPNIGIVLLVFLGGGDIV